MELSQLQPGSAKAEQIQAFFEHAIDAGRLRPGDRLPTIRDLAGDLAVARNVVQEAYRQLAARGLVVATVGRGTTVARAEGNEGPLTAQARATFRYLQEQAGQELRPAGPITANFAQMHPDQELFPVSDFQESLQRVLSANGKTILSYSDPSGDPDLRKLLAARVSDMDSAGQPEEVLVTGGAQQGLDLVLRAFTRPGDAVAVPVPTYHHLFGLLEAHGLRIVPLRSDENLLEDLQRALQRPELRLVYVMPTFQNPTGRSMDLAAREAFLQVLNGTDVPVLEDEFDLELRFAGKDLPSLRALDRRQMTVTVRTFSKGLFPGVRLGWVHADPELLGPMAAMKRFIDLETSPLLQAALLDFLQRGLVDRYLQKLRRELGLRHAAGKAALEQHMPEGSRWTEPLGGFAVWLEPAAGAGGARLVRAAADRGVLVSPGSLFHPGAPDVPGIRISLSRSPVAEVEAGIAVLGKCSKELLARTDRPEGSPIFM